MTPHCRWAAKLYCTGKEWLLLRLFFTKSLLFILGMMVGQQFVDKVILSVLVVYVSERWSTYNILKATSLTNAFFGISSMLTVVVAYISFKWKSRFKTILTTGAAFFTGSVLMLLSLAKVIGGSGTVTMYVAALLMSFGSAGRWLVYDFLVHQLKQHNDVPIKVENIAIERANFWWTVCRFFSAVVAFLWFSNYDYWKKNFIASTIALLVGGLMFWFGVCYYHKDENTATLDVRSLVRVVKTAFLKRYLDHPPQRISPQFCRCLDKATIIEENTPVLGENQICTVSQVQELKLLITMLPMWMTFIIFSLIDATGITFFFQQSSNLNNIINNKYQVPLQTFYLMGVFTGFVITNLYNLLLPKKWSKAKRKRATLIRIGVGMFCSILSCICAWKVEHHRLHLVAELKMQCDDDTQVEVAMSIFWLSPQFIFLGSMKGLCEDGLDDFLHFQSGYSRMKILEVPLNVFVIGLWQLFIIPIMYACHGWIKNDINCSRMDKYYRFLAIFAVVNIFFYICFAIKLYGNQEPVITSQSVVDHEFLQDDSTLKT